MNKENFNKFLTHVPTVGLIIFGLIFIFVGAFITGPGLFTDSPGSNIFIDLGHTPLQIGQILLAVGFIIGFLKFIRLLFKINRNFNRKK